MGSKPEMIRKYLVAVGLGSSIFGFGFFVVSVLHSIFIIGDEAFLKATIADKVATFAVGFTRYGVDAFALLTLGGVCLYLAYRIAKDMNDEV